MSSVDSPSSQGVHVPPLGRSSSRSSGRHQPASPRQSALDSDLKSPNSVMPQRHRNHSERGERAKEEDEALLRSFEAEEERLVNSLTRKLERLRYDRAKLEQDLEAEGEAMVLRLQRQLALLQQQQTSGSITGASPSASPRVPTHSSGVPGDDVLRLENESLRERLAHAEQEFSKHALVASNYRRELVSLRNKLGLDTSDLTPLSSSPSASATHRDLSSSGASSIHDILASPDFHPQVQSWSQRSTGETTPSDRSYATPLVPINTPAYSIPVQGWGMSPPPVPANSLTSSVADPHTYHPHPQMTQPHRRASHIAEEGQLPQARNRRSASVTLDRVSESHDAEESDQVGQPPTRNKDDDELVAGEME